MQFGQAKQSILPSRLLVVAWLLFLVADVLLVAFGVWSPGKATSNLLTGSGAILIADALQPPPDV
jgi:hypothetical protein